MYRSSKPIGSSGSGSTRYNEKMSSRHHNIGTGLIDEDEFKQDHNQIYNDDSKFARQLKKLLRDEEEERKIQKMIDLSSYLDHYENIKFVLKLGKQSLNILLKLLSEQQLSESKSYLVECISKIGNIMMGDRDPNKYFDWIVDKISVMQGENKKENSKDNNLKILILDALLQSFKNENLNRYLKDNVNFILNSLKKMLESVENPSLMMQIAKIILYLSKLFPEATNYIFQDVVDILIAWHIDCSQPDEVIEFTSNSLVQLRENWLRDIDFTINLLEQFLEDMESYLNAYLEDTNKRFEIENIEKISALFKVYNTVIKSISCIDDPYHKPLKLFLNQTEIQQITGTMNRLLKCICKIYASKYSELLFKPANNCIILFIDIFDDKVYVLNDLLVDYLIKQNKIEKIWSYDVDSSYLALLFKILPYFISTNNVDLIKEILSFDGRLWNYKFSQNSKIIQETLNIYKVLIIVKSIPIVQEVYKNILTDTDLSFNTILKHSTSNEANIQEELTQINLKLATTKKGVLLLENLKHAETSFLFNLCVFAELGKAKNNLILMYALSPTLFELLTGKLSPCNWNLAEYFPNIQYGILNRLYSHSVIHDHFIINSSLFTNNKYGTDSPNKDYFRIIIEILTKLLSHPSTSFETSLLSLNWVFKIIDLLLIENGFIFESSLFINFLNSIITTAYSHEEEICLLTSQILLKIIQKFDKLSLPILARTYDLCKYFMMSSDKNIRLSYMKLLSFIPINLSLSLKTDIKYLTNIDFSNFSSLARNNYILSSSDCIISTQNFKSIMGFVLAGILTTSDLYEKSWLERIYFSCKRHNSDEKLNKELIHHGKESIMIDSIIENHDGILWFWALWECAQFCVQSRLKTPLGKAQDTFVAIENVIKNYFNFENLNQSYSANSDEKPKHFFIDLSRISLLLHFIEYLERIIYNAYEGIASGQNLVSKAVKVFFRTNKSTCNEWFSRVRFYIINLSIKCGHYEIAIRHSYEYIQYCVDHNLTNSNEFDQVISSLVKSLIRLKSWQSLLGLNEWLSKTLKKNNYKWIKIAALEAQGKFEISSQNYKENIQTNLNEMNNEKQSNISQSQLSMFKFQCERIFECYFELHDWNEYLSWYEEYKTNVLERIENQSLNNEIQNRIDLNFIKALSSFEHQDFELVINDSKQLFKTESLENLLLTINSKWNIDDIESLTLKELFKTIIDKRLNLQNTCFSEELSKELSNILNIDEMSYLNHEKLILINLLNLLKNQQPTKNFSKSSMFSSNKHSLKFLNQIVFYENNQYNNESFDFYLSCIKFARKQHNYKLGTKLLTHQLSYLRSVLNLNHNYNNYQDLYTSVKSYTLDLDHIDAFKTFTNNKLKIYNAEFQKESAKFIRKIDSHSLNSIDILSKSISTYLNNNNLNLIDNKPNHLNFTQSQTFSPGVPFNLPSQVNSNSINNDLLNEKYSRTILTLSKWLISNQALLKDINYLFKLNQFNQEITLTEKIYLNLSKIINFKYKNQDNLKFNLKIDLNLNNNEAIIGDLIDLTTVLSPKLAKSWYTLANWSFKLAKLNLDKINEKNNPDLFDLLPSHLTDEEKDFILNLFSNGLSSLSMCYSNLNQSFEQFNRDLFNQEARDLLNQNCSNLTKDSIDLILDFYNQIINQVIYYNKIACKSYFTYLSLNDKTNDEKNISATLRIVKLLMKYAIEFKSELQEGLSSTPTQPWKNIIPQLFSRLNHPEEYIRECISQLLCRIARDFPHLIIYPAVVGSQDGPTKIETVHSSNNNNLFENINKSDHTVNKQDQQEVLNENLDQDSENEEAEFAQELSNSDESEENDQQEEAEQDVQVDEDENEEEYEESEIIHEEQKVELKNAYKYLLDTLSESNPKMVDQVKLFVHEMRRITLLREELWYGTLNQINSDLNKRIEQLNSEILKLNSNQSLAESEKLSITKEKYEILLQPIVSVLEHVHEITTNLSPETPNEEQFQFEFGKKIVDALEQIKDKNNAFKPSNSISLLKQLHTTFHQRSQSRQSTSLLMDQISPKLANLKSTTIPIPGKDGHYCTIYSIANNVHVLPTKTKPKKLYFIGSNGKRYPYLFKGLEDLHLDERIMQLLSIINTMFNKINKTETIHYHALNYSVTPLGPRSGLISWVEGATPLFTLYKKWQQREAIYSFIKQGQQIPQQIQIPRPNDIYYTKLNPILKEKNIKNFHENRSECPLNILRHVLEELIKETPNDLLSKELWCNSSTPGNWWNSLKIYSRSTSVMSMIGYIIGLGDRHLDNVLINLCTGQVAHIDYNICFEKGHNLRVPERVPFRMTQNLQYALGLTGVEGTYRLSCEQVMEILRLNKETLLSLLETFVYDPLLDWTGHDTGIIASFYGGGPSKQDEATQTNLLKRTKETRKNLEKKLNLRLYEIRLIENKSQAELNQESILKIISNQLDLINLICDLSEKRDMKENLISLYEKSKIYLDESLTLQSRSNQHPVFTLHERYEQYQEYNQKIETINNLIDKEIEKFESYSVGHSNMINYFKNLDPNKLTNLLYNDIIEKEISQKPYECVKEFLESIGQSNLVEMTENLINDISKIELSSQKLVKSASDLVIKQAQLYSYLPNEINLNSQHVKLLDWLKEIRISNNSKVVLENIYSKYKNLYKHKHVNDEELNIKEIDNKILLIKNESDLTRSKIENLKERKMRIELENGSENDLKLNHDLIFDCNLIGFINQELNIMPEQLYESFNYVLLHFLNDNLQKWLSMENAAFGSKENLVNITSQDGDWYLEEMLSLMLNCNHLTHLIKQSYLKFGFKLEDNLSKSLDIFDSLEVIFLNLKDVLFNYGNCLYDKLLINSFSNLNDLNFVLNELEQMNLNTFFDMISKLNLVEHDFTSDTDYISILNDIKFKYSKLLTNKQNRICTDVLIELEKLFCKIDTEFEKLIKFIKACYNEQDQNLINQTYFILTPNLIYLFDNSVFSFYKNLFLVKKIETIFSCVNLIAQYRQYCFGSNNLFVFSHEEFIIPFKSYISEFIVQMMIGVPTILIGNLLNILKNDPYPKSDYMDLTIIGQNEYFSYLLNQKLISNQINQYYFDTFNQIVMNHDSIWINLDTLKRIKSNTDFNQSLLKTTLNLLESVEWYYNPIKNEESLKLILDEFKKFKTNLNNQFLKMSSLFESLKTNEQSILKRLEWSSKTSPLLNDTIKQYDLIKNKIDCKFKTELNNLNKLLHVADMFVNFESFRTENSDQLNEAKNSFENLLTKIENSDIFDSNNIAKISDIELNLINFTSFKNKKPLTHSIIQEYYKLIYEEVAQMKRNKQKEEKETQSKIEEIAKSVSELKIILNQHNKIMTDIKPLLKTISKYGENERIQEYTKLYLKFSENCQQLVRILSNQDMIQNNPKDIKEKLILLKNIIPNIYSDLEHINETPEKKAADSQTQKQEFKPALTRLVSKLDKKIQESNSHAVSVWKRVYQKLEGRDLDANIELDIKEQVDYLINQATDLNNLALLYEGWTPWV